MSSGLFTLLLRKLFVANHTVGLYFMTYVRQGFKDFDGVESSGSKPCQSFLFFLTSHLFKLFLDFLGSATTNPLLERHDFVVKGFLIVDVGDLNPENEIRQTLMSFVETVSSVKTVQPSSTMTLTRKLFFK